MFPLLLLWALLIDSGVFDFRRVLAWYLKRWVRVSSPLRAFLLLLLLSNLLVDPSEFRLLASILHSLVDRV